MQNPTASKKWRVAKSSIDEVAGEIATELRGRDKFVLWLTGDLGVGKTTLAGALLHAIGLPRDVPVLSPTFAFMTEYKTDVGSVAHLDLYRLSTGDEDSVEGFLSGRNFAGVIVEWPERAASSSLISRTHEIRLQFASEDDERDVELFIY